MPEILVRPQRRREHLERYLPVEPLVLAAENYRHSAPADLLLQPVPGDPRADGETGQEPGHSRALNAHHVSTAGRPLPALLCPWARPEPIPDGQARAGEMEQIRINKADPTPCSRPPRHGSPWLQTRSPKLARRQQTRGRTSGK